MKNSFHLNPSSISHFVDLPVNHRLSHTTRDYHRLGSRLLLEPDVYRKQNIEYHRLGIEG